MGPELGVDYNACSRQNKNEALVAIPSRSIQTEDDTHEEKTLLRHGGSNSPHVPLRRWSVWNLG